MCERKKKYEQSLQTAPHKTNMRRGKKSNALAFTKVVNILLCLTVLQLKHDVDMLSWHALVTAASCFTLSAKHVDRRH